MRDYEEVDSGYEKPCSNPRIRIGLRLGLGFRPIFRSVLGVGPGDRIRGKLESESGRRSGKWTVSDGEKRNEESEEIEG